MKNLLLIFKDLHEYLQVEKVNLVINSLSQFNFLVDDVKIINSKKIQETFENFDNIRQPYDNIFVLESNCKEFEEGISSLSPFFYRESHGEKDFSLFVIGSDIKKSVSEDIAPSLEKKYSVKYGKVIFKTYGLKRRKILEVTNKIQSQTGVRFDVYEDNLDCKTEIIYTDKSTKMDYDSAQKQFITAFKDNIYAETDTSLEQILVDLLRLRKCVISTAESFTGGNISAKITSISGASKVFYEGIVCYNENSKRDRLLVRQATIDEYKPVSCQVAGEMAFGLIKNKNADIGISTTGIAGPNSDDSNFPVGLCFIGVAYGGEVKVYRYNFDGDRQSVIDKGTKTAIFLAIKTIKNI